MNREEEARIALVERNLHRAWQDLDAAMKDVRHCSLELARIRSESDVRMVRLAKRHPWYKRFFSWLTEGT